LPERLPGWWLEPTQVKQPEQRMLPWPLQQVPPLQEHQPLEQKSALPGPAAGAELPCRIPSGRQR
jgi:hypothetical protein